MKKLQKNIPEAWQLNNLGFFLEKIHGGGTPSKDNPVYWNGSIPWASVKDVVTHNPNSTQDYISEFGLRNSSSQLVTKGTLIVPTRMALGHAVFFNVDVAINQDLKALYPKKELNNKYLYYWFKANKKFIERLGSGSTVSGIQQNELKSIKFLCPPLPEQNRMVAVLETWDKAIEKLEKKIEIKKKIKKGLMQQLLSGKKRLPGFLGPWNILSLGEICKRIKRKNVEGNRNVLTISAQEGLISQSEFFNKQVAADNLENYTLLHKGDFAYNKSYSKGYPMGAIKRLDKYDKGVVSSLYITFVAENINSDFLKFYYDNGLFNEELAKVAQEGARNHGLLNIGIEDFFDCDLHIPPSQKEQVAIAEVIETSEKSVILLQKKLKFLKDQRKYLLNNLITGVIRTPESLKVN